MVIYLLNRESNELIQVFDDVIRWRADYVEYLNSGHPCKIYCDSEIEYFTNEYIHDEK